MILSPEFEKMLSVTEIPVVCKILILQIPHGNQTVSFQQIDSPCMEECEAKLPILRADPVRFAAPMKVKLATKRKVPPKKQKIHC